MADRGNWGWVFAWLVTAGTGHNGLRYLQSGRICLGSFTSFGFVSLKTADKNNARNDWDLKLSLWKDLVNFRYGYVCTRITVTAAVAGTSHAK